MLSLNVWCAPACDIEQPAPRKIPSWALKYGFSSTFHKENHSFYVLG